MLALVAVAGHRPLAAQDPALMRGDRLRVRHDCAAGSVVATNIAERCRTTVGSLVSLRPGELRVQTNAGIVVPLPTPVIERLDVSRSTRSLAAEGALVGAGVALAGYLAIRATSADPLNSLTIVMIPLGAALGAIVGNRYHADQWNQVPPTRYR